MQEDLNPPPARGRLQGHLRRGLQRQLHGGPRVHRLLRRLQRLLPGQLRGLLPELGHLDRLAEPHEPNHVELIWAVRKVTPAQAKYIGMFYGEEILHAISA